MEIERKINIKLKRTKDDMNSWEVNDFLDKLSNFSYKYELLNEIGKHIDNGVNPEDIIILSNSFDFTQKYRSLKNRNKINLKKDGDVTALYHLGKPVSFFPNDRIYKFNFMFQVFREYNELLRTFKCNRLSKDLLCEYAKYSLDEVVNKLRENSKINFNISLNDNTDENNDKIIQRFEAENNKIVKKYKDKIQVYNNCKVEFNNVLTKDILDVPKEYRQTYLSIENKYFKGFSKLFSKLDRPIVGIYNEQEDYIDILCINYIHKNEKSEKSVAIKEISHNSPLFFDLLIVGSMAPAVYGLVKCIQVNNNNNKIKSDNENQKEKYLKNLAEIENKIEILEQNYPISNIDNMENSYFKDIIIEIKDSLNNKSVANFKNNKLDNNNVVIDFENYRTVRVTKNIETDIIRYSKEEIHEKLVTNLTTITNIDIKNKIYNIKEEECYLAIVESKDIFQQVVNNKFYIGINTLNIYNYFNHDIMWCLEYTSSEDKK